MPDGGSAIGVGFAREVFVEEFFTRDGPQMTGSMFATFLVAWAAVTLLAYTLYRVELAGKRLDADLRELREALL